MRLSNIEFRAMNNPLRRFIQKHVEFRRFRKMGLAGSNRRILEIGCGSGYGAQLLSSLKPRSYLGIDLMPEQIELAERRGLPAAEFQVRDASDLQPLADGSIDQVVIFGILHHVPTWRRVIAEVGRVLCEGGEFFIEEPDGGAIRRWDRVFRWNHPQEALFSLDELEEAMRTSGLTIVSRRRWPFFGFYYARRIAASA